MLKKRLVLFNFIELLVWEVRCGEYRSRPLSTIKKALGIIFWRNCMYGAYRKLHSTPYCTGFHRNYPCQCLVKLFSKFLFAWKQIHGIPRDKCPAPPRPGTVSLETFAASENFLSFIVPGFAIPAARDTRNTAIVLIVVSWQSRILWTCWMSKTFASCNLNWAVPGWENRILWLGIWENFAYFRRTLEVSNKCRDSNLAWLKFRAYKYCNECHEVFF